MISSLLRYLPWIAVLLATALPAHAFISEPETVVYGRILNRNGGPTDQLITSGNLLWKIRKADGTRISLTGEVGELAGGSSYFLRIPHQALVLGETQSARTLPLGITKSSASHIEITLDGRSTRILSPATSNLDLQQSLRAGTHRLDLEVQLPELDTDGDGIPDWWEDLHGLDKEDTADALLDGDNDGLNNRAEYLAGIDPAHDSRHPQILTAEVIAYAASKSIVVLETADIDSSPAQLTYTLDAAPSGGRIFLRNPDTTLSETATFTQSQVNDGRVIFAHTDAEEPGILDVTVRDENPAHPADTASVRILLFNPAPGITAQDGSEKLRLFAHHLSSSSSGHLVADLSSTSGAHKLSAASAAILATNYPAHLSTFGPEKPHILIGGPSSDELTGGYSDDILSGGPGPDILTGSLGADNFVYTDARSGNDTITDFNPAENDAIDLSSVLIGTSTNLFDYVRIQADGADAIVGVSLAGTDTGYSDITIRLKNSTLRQADLAGLYYASHIITGRAALAPRISVAASAVKASENGPLSSHFTVTREGPVASEISARISLSGTATNGVDYQIIGSTVTIPAGAASVTIPVIPFVDAIFESDEIITLSLGADPAYLLGASTAQLVIEDLKPQFWTEVTESLASVSDLSPASLTIHRGGAIDRPATVQLAYAGTAVKNTDYANPPASLAFAAWDTEKQLDIRPLASAAFGSSEGKTVTITIKSSANYISPATADRIIIVPEKLTYESWRTTALTTRSGPLLTSEDPGGYGMNMLLRYGFSLDPENPYADAGIDRLPKVDFLNGRLALRFRRKPGITDLNYQVQYSTDLKDWKTGPDFVEDISSQIAPEDPSTIIYRAKTPISATPSASMRVVIIKPDNQ